MSKAKLDPEEEPRLQRLRSGTTEEESSVCGKGSRQVQHPDVRESGRWRSRKDGAAEGHIRPAASVGPSTSPLAPRASPSSMVGRIAEAVSTVPSFGEHLVRLIGRSPEFRWRTNAHLFPKQPASDLQPAWPLIFVRSVALVCAASRQVQIVSPRYGASTVVAQHPPPVSHSASRPDRTSRDRRSTPAEDQLRRPKR